MPKFKMGKEKPKPGKPGTPGFVPTPRVPKPVGPKKPGRKTIMPVKPKRGM